MLAYVAYDPKNGFQTDDVNKLRYHLFFVSPNSNLQGIPPRTTFCIQLNAGE